MEFKPVKKTFFQTALGKTVIIFLIIIGLIVLGFGGLVGYYAWQIKSGKGDILFQKFNSTQNTQSYRIANKSAKTLVTPADPSTGDTNSTITIVAFTDFNCQYSRSAYPEFKNMINTYSPVARIVFKPISVEGVESPSYLASLASLCANDQGKSLEYYNLLFSNADLDEEALNNYAEILKLNTKTFSTCLSSKKHATDLNNNTQSALDLNLRGTPTFIVNDIIIDGVITKEEWDKVILDEMK